MQEALPRPRLAEPLSFGRFITELMQALQAQGVRPFVLRNYEGFPERNDGSDVDFLILRSWLPAAVRALRSIAGTRIVGYAERSYVAHLFVEGVAAQPGVRALAVDFIWNLNWKGQNYLATELLLQAGIERQSGGLRFFVPDRVHEAITSLTGSLISGAVVREKYFPAVQEGFTAARTETIHALSVRFGLRASVRLVDAVIEGNRKSIRACARQLRVSLVMRSLARSPLRAFRAAMGYHARECAVRLLPQTQETVRIVNPGGQDCAVLIEGLLSRLRNTAKEVEWRGAVSPASGRGSSRGCKRWLAAEWLHVFRKRGNLTLSIHTSPWYDLLPQPKANKRGVIGPLTRIAAWLLPSSDLWVVLACPAGEHGVITEEPVVPGREVPPAMNRSFLPLRGDSILIDASCSINQVTDSAAAAIIEQLAQRATKTLRKRLQIT